MLAKYIAPPSRPPTEVGTEVIEDHCLRLLRMARYSDQVMGRLRGDV